MLSSNELKSVVYIPQTGFPTQLLPNPYGLKPITGDSRINSF